MCEFRYSNYRQSNSGEFTQILVKIRVISQFLPGPRNRRKSSEINGNRRRNKRNRRQLSEIGNYLWRENISLIKSSQILCKRLHQIYLFDCLCEIICRRPLCEWGGTGKIVAHSLHPIIYIVLHGTWRSVFVLSSISYLFFVNRKKTKNRPISHQISIILKYF